MATTAAYTDATAIPSQPEVEEALRIGAVDPDHYDAGLCVACDVPIAGMGLFSTDGIARASLK